MNPAQGMKMPRVPAGRVRYLQPVELHAVLDACPECIGGGQAVRQCIWERAAVGIGGKVLVQQAIRQSSGSIVPTCAGERCEYRLVIRKSR